MFRIIKIYIFLITISTLVFGVKLIMKFFFHIKAAYTERKI